MPPTGRIVPTKERPRALRTPGARHKERDLPMQDTPYGYCHCGCGQQTRICPTTKANRPHQVKGQPYRYVKGHRHRAQGPDYIVNPETDCWVWQRSTTPAGYGMATATS
jgi:hypothetical protein